MLNHANIFILFVSIKRGKNLHVIGEGLTFDDVLIVPVRSTISSRKDIDTSTRLTKNILLNIPIGSVPMDTVTESEMAIALAREGGLGIIHRFLTIAEQCNEVLKVKNAGVDTTTSSGTLMKEIAPLYLNGSKPTLDKEGRLVCCAAVGLKDTLERADALIKAGCDILCLDVAHAHSDNFIKAIRDVKKEFDIDLIAGNVATREGAEDFVSAGVDCVKVGIGPGSTCITRIVTGCGIPQLTAISWAAEACSGQNVTIIADGGMRCSGDLVKALAAGADVGIFGGLFSGTDEATSKMIVENGKKYKICRGMASSGAMKRRLAVEDNENCANGNGSNGNGKYTAPEGAEIKVPYRGGIHNLIANLEAGLRSGMSYCGAHNLAELRQNARFMRVTSATKIESEPHNEFWI